jgi:hypothetical protein
MDRHDVPHDGPAAAARNRGRNNANATRRLRVSKHTVTVHGAPPNPVLQTVTSS